MNQKCKNCIMIISLTAVFVVHECPFPQKDCEIKEKAIQMHDHRELKTGPPPVKYATFVTGSTIEIIRSPYIELVTEDRDRPGFRIYKTVSFSE